MIKTIGADALDKISLKDLLMWLGNDLSGELVVPITEDEAFVVRYELRHVLTMLEDHHRRAEVLAHWQEAYERKQLPGSLRLIRWLGGRFRGTAPEPPSVN